MGSYVQIQYCSKNPMFVGSSFLNKDHNFQTKTWSNSRETTLTPKKQFQLKYWGETENGKRISKGNGKGIVCHGFLFPVDSWAPNFDSPVIASQLSAFSLLPYLGFLYFITKSKSAPRLTLIGFYFLLAFVGAAKSSMFRYVLTISSPVFTTSPPLCSTSRNLCKGALCNILVQCRLVAWWS
ncbi:hypothetical protein Pfo_010474 [Paulownia fortunei]|nr:hypothetical protein Pfo_010474 [Paulownia fortunei]